MPGYDPGKEYKILKRDAVTVFYDADGNTLFDVTNDRLKKEYESDHGEEKETEDAAEGVEMGKASLADIITGNLPDPTPEEIEIAEKANAGDVQAKAKQKLGDELKSAGNKAFAIPIMTYLKSGVMKIRAWRKIYCKSTKPGKSALTTSMRKQGDTLLGAA